MCVCHLEIAENACTDINAPTLDLQGSQLVFLAQCDEFEDLGAIAMVSMMKIGR